jgi:RNA-directed DNA polymerase
MAARVDREARFTSLMHHMTPELLRAAFDGLHRKAAAGVDGMTWHEYAQDVEARLADLHDRVQRGGYWVSPSLRTYIPKAGGGQRPLGIATLEDKIVQRVLAEVLNAIYEVDFLGFSYGFRPGRNPHQALDAVTVAIEGKKVNWVLDADIRGFFDAIDHGRLVAMLEHRIGDPRILRLIRKMLAAGVMEEGQWRTTDRGAAQGASLSPLLANVYLHYAFDTWAHAWRKSEARGEVYLVRFADDFLVCIQDRKDAQRFQAALAERLAAFGLELHPEKTRLLEFGRFAAENRARAGKGKPESFDFLGFTHMCSRTRGGRVHGTSHAHAEADGGQAEGDQRDPEAQPPPPHRGAGPLDRLGRAGGGNYFAVPRTSQVLKRFHDVVCRHRIKALRRRGQKHRLAWRRFVVWRNMFIPAPKILHPWPNERFAMRLTQGRSPVR